MVFLTLPPVATHPAHSSQSKEKSNKAQNHYGKVKCPTISCNVVSNAVGIPFFVSASVLFFPTICLVIRKDEEKSLSVHKSPMFALIKFRSAEKSHVCTDNLLCTFPQLFSYHQGNCGRTKRTLLKRNSYLRHSFQPWKAFAWISTF